MLYLEYIHTQWFVILSGGAHVYVPSQILQIFDKNTHRENISWTHIMQIRLLCSHVEYIYPNWFPFSMNRGSLLRKHFSPLLSTQCVVFKFIGLMDGWMDAGRGRALNFVPQFVCSSRAQQFRHFHSGDSGSVVWIRYGYRFIRISCVWFNGQLCWFLRLLLLC